MWWVIILIMTLLKMDTSYLVQQIPSLILLLRFDPQFVVLHRFQVCCHLNLLMNCWHQSPLCLYWITLMYITSLTCILSFNSVWHLQSQATLGLMNVSSLESCFFLFYTCLKHHNDPWGTLVELFSLMINELRIAM